MASKALIFLIASFLLLATKASSKDDEDFFSEVLAKTPAPAPAPVKAPPPTLPPVSITECPRLCGVRCSLHSRKRHCTRVCMTCCQRCKCVPPGTYGNKEMCGKCYTDMTTHGNRPKCP
ncbi:gibberellin-regulated protein 14-like [Macadamia integrifolia]|uniref:gibberellin-regulated protein 14-like n=1 Tax=Macadamia integrifolia TaxID=60698 RepID=UPI001C50070A|nr:gibberellin-regulated protein 14-like [Macadamia integrifolia]